MARVLPGREQSACLWEKSCPASPEARGRKQVVADPLLVPVVAPALAGGSVRATEDRGRQGPGQSTCTCRAPLRVVPACLGLRRGRGVFVGQGHSALSYRRGRSGDPWGHSSVKGRAPRSLGTEATPHRTRAEGLASQGATGGRGMFSRLEGELRGHWGLSHGGRSLVGAGHFILGE